MVRAIDGTWNSFLLNLSYLTLRDFQENKAGLNTLKTAVESQPTLTPPNEPLSIEQLREMNGEPVWFDTIKRWGIVIVRSAEVSVLTKSGEFDVTRLKFYRRPPEGEEDT